jgi:hypothetical protein
MEWRIMWKTLKRQMNSLISTQRRNFIEGSNEYDKKDRGGNSVECGVLDVKFYEEK